ncbi:ceramide synthase 4 isoform X4 [Phyllostomus hastatus]|uniref:ceramide synthase 4 isoform X4 n=1 Tax=Phyllostomus hastatus TaxID=9423 RepID=UPI001E6810CB|nr:ceramide synthase 4 isoform X4 [Phyllostomus hastatus]
MVGMTTEEETADPLQWRMWSSLNEWLWQDRFWLPPNSSWADLEDRDGRVYAHPQDMLAALPLALALVVVRFTFERLVGLPLSRWLGVRNRARRPVQPNATLEKHFLVEGQRPTEPEMVILATQCGLTLRQTQRWFRRRRNQDRPCLTKKFCEASWRFAFYLFSFFGGLSVLYHESWLWRPAMCWDNYPYQTLKPALYYWYLLELSFYISLLITLSFDIRRKACKMFNYAHQWRVCNSLFIVFSLVFFYTRLVLFPTQILYTTYYESIANSGPFFGYYFFNSLLVMLQLLHVFWSCLILRMIRNFTKKGQLEKDIRSDMEESDSSEGEEAQEHPKLKNGAAQGPGVASTDGPRSRAAWRLANGHMLAT